MPEVCSKLYVERTLRIFDHTKKTIKSGHSQMPRGTGISIYLTTCPRIQAIHVGRYTYHSSPGSSKTPPSLKRSVSVSQKIPWMSFHLGFGQFTRDPFSAFAETMEQKRATKGTGSKLSTHTHTQNRDTHINQPNPTQPNPTQPTNSTQPHHFPQILPPPFHPHYSSPDFHLG